VSARLTTIAFSAALCLAGPACGGKLEGVEAVEDGNVCDREPSVNVDHACLGLSDASGPLLLNTKETFGYRVGTLHRVSGWFTRPTAEVDRRRETELTVMPVIAGDSSFTAGSDSPTVTWQVAETTCVKNPDPGREDGIKEGRNCLNHFVERWHAVAGTMQCAQEETHVACRLHDVRFETGDPTRAFTASGWVHATLPDEHW
jgi:hypothetical protein